MFISSIQPLLNQEWPQARVAIRILGDESVDKGGAVVSIAYKDINEAFSRRKSERAGNNR